MILKQVQDMILGDKKRLFTKASSLIEEEDIFYLFVKSLKE